MAKNTHAPIMNAQVSIVSHGDAPPVLKSRFTFDCTRLRDPEGQPQLKSLDGDHMLVRLWVSADPRVKLMSDMCLLYVNDMLRETPSKNFITFAFRDKKGKWIAPAVAEVVATALEQKGLRVHVAHEQLS